MQLRLYLNYKIYYLFGLISGAIIVLLASICLSNSHKILVAELDLDKVIAKQAMQYAALINQDVDISKLFSTKLLKLKSKLPKNLILVKKAAVLSQHSLVDYTPQVLAWLDEEL